MLQRPPKKLFSAIARKWLPILFLAFSTPDGHAAERGELIVSETAGIRRFGYPVSAKLTFAKPLAEGTAFRLLHDGKPVAAQFRRMTDNKTSSTVSLDFDASFLPHEDRAYVIEYGSDVAPVDEPPPGMEIEELDDHYLVTHSKYLAWKVPKTLRGLFDSVTYHDAKTNSVIEFIRPASTGFYILAQNADPQSIGGENSSARVVGSRIVKQGTIQSELEFDVELKNESSSVASTIRLGFPRSKSWVEIDWTFNDDDGVLVGCGIDQNLNISGEPTLVDFGAGSLVYAPLAPRQSIQMTAGDDENDRQSWRVFRGSGEKLEPYVVQSEAFPALAEGWAHVMNHDRCAAISVADFARSSSDSMRIDSDGLTRISRAWHADDDNAKSLHIWYHYVTMPVHVGAATSPQSMLVPLLVEWSPSP